MDGDPLTIFAVGIGVAFVALLVVVAWKQPK
jgi:hypothetical protein